jgi:hypothetical protein
MVLAFHGHPSIIALCAPFAVVAVGLAMGLLLSRALDVVLQPGDPRRLVVADPIAYGGTILAVALSRRIR